MSPLQGKLSALVLCATALVFCNAARADLVTNGGFVETGDFTGWTQFGNTGFSGVTCSGGATWWFVLCLFWSGWFQWWY